MKCILCNARRGKRHCPAKNSLICAPCCGQKRVVEIDCPPDCGYLIEGHGRQSAMKYLRLIQQEEDRERGLRLYENRLVYRPLISEIERTILQYGKGLRSFRDRHVLEALRLLFKTYQSEDRGIIYEHKSTDPMVNALVRDIRDLLEQCREDLEPAIRPSDFVECMEVMEWEVRYHLQQSDKEEPYLIFIRKTHPGAAPAGSGEDLIVL